ncbi:MAG: LPXTG cell wall anchor domain-containing protein, partial [Paeniglutamicibacter terrestris]
TTSPEPSEQPTTSPEPSEQPTTSPEPSEQPTTSPEPTQEPTKAPVEPQGNTNNNGDKDPLANTGPNVALPFIATGGALLVAAGAFLLFRRKGSHGA